MKTTGSARRHRWIAALTTTLMVATATAALADVKLGSEDVTVIGAASVAPSGQTLVRAGAEEAFDLAIALNEGNINDNPNSCDEEDNTITAPEDFVVGATGLSGSAATTTIVLDCVNYSQGPATETFEDRGLAAGAGAPLGRSSHAVSFGSDGLVTFGKQVTLKDGFTPPSLYVTVLPRPASSLQATAGDASVTLNWTTSADDADITSYVIEQKSGASYGAVGTVARGVATYDVTGLTNGTNYCFAVTARFTNSDGNFDSVRTADACAEPQASSTAATATFKQPIDGNAINIAKLGRTIPVKATIDSGPEATGGGFVSVSRTKIPCDASSWSDSVETYTTGNSNLGNQFRWDSSSSHWIFNFNTSGLAVGTCHKIEVSVGGSASSDTGVVTGGTPAGEFTIRITK